MGTVTVARTSHTWEEDGDSWWADRLLTHMASEHGIPVSISLQIPAVALAKLCRDDQAQDLEDWQR